MNTYERIKALCDKKGLTIAELERKADVGNGTIRRWGNTLPSGDKLQRVAKYLNVTIDYLVNGEKDEFDEDVRAIARASQKLTPDKRDLLHKLALSMIDEAEKDLSNDK